MYVCVYVYVHRCALFEFWKRRQFQLQYDWDMLGFEDAEVCMHCNCTCMYVHVRACTYMYKLYGLKGFPTHQPS